MACCKAATFSAEQVDTLKASAVGLGLPDGTVADWLERYGPKVLTLAVEALRGGLTVATVVEVVRIFGPGVLDFLVSLLNQSRMMANADVACEGAGFMSGSMVALLLDKYLPVLLHKFGPEVVKLVFDWVQKSLQPTKTVVPDPSVTPVPAEQI